MLGRLMEKVCDEMAAKAAAPPAPKPVLEGEEKQDDGEVKADQPDDTSTPDQAKKPAVVLDSVEDRANLISDLMDDANKHKKKAAVNHDTDDEDEDTDGDTSDETSDDDTGGKDDDDDELQNKTLNDLLET